MRAPWLLLAVPFLAAAAKVKPVKAGPIKVLDERRVEQGERCRVTLDVPSLKGMDDAAAQAELNAALRRGVDAIADEVCALADQPGAIDADAPIPYEVVATYTVTLATGRWVSLWQTVSRWTGEGNTFDERVGFTIDVETGQIVRLEQLFHPRAGWKPLVDATVRSAIIAHPDTWFADAASRFEGVHGSTTFVLTPEGVVVSFPYVTLAPSKAGFPEVLIPYARLDGLWQPGVALPP